MARRRRWLIFGLSFVLISYFNCRHIDHHLTETHQPSVHPYSLVSIPLNSITQRGLAQQRCHFVSSLACCLETCSMLRAIASPTIYVQRWSFCMHHSLDHVDQLFHSFAAVPLKEYCVWASLLNYHQCYGRHPMYKSQCQYYHRHI